MLAGRLGSGLWGSGQLAHLIVVVYLDDVASAGFDLHGVADDLVLVFMRVNSI